MYAFLFRLSGDEELVRERMCCAIALSLSLSFTLSKHKDQVPVWRGETRTHTLTHALNMRIQNYHLNKKTKMASYGSYVLVSNKRKKKKHCADWYITDTNQPSHISRSHSQTYTFTKIFTSITNPICLIFFLFLLFLF